MDNYELWHSERRAWTCDLWSRLGRFFISDQIIRPMPKLVLDLLRDVVVVQMEYAYDRQGYRYVGMSQQFQVWDKPENGPWDDAPIYPINQIERKLDGGIVLWKLEFGNPGESTIRRLDP